MDKNLDTSILDDKLFTLQEAAEICRVSSQTLQKEIDEGKLQANKIRGQWRIFERTLIKYLKETRTTKKQNRPIRQPRP